MSFTLKPTVYFLKQLKELSYNSRQLIQNKLQLISTNPTRNKRIFGYNLFLFRIRFSDNQKEKRIIYVLNKKEIKILCILDRKNNYKDLKKILRKLNLK